jgi:hypothetical protein
MAECLYAWTMPTTASPFPTCGHVGNGTRLDNPALLRRGVVAALSSTKALLASDTLISDLWSIVNSDPFSHTRI